MYKRRKIPSNILDSIRGSTLLPIEIHYYTDGVDPFQYLSAELLYIIFSYLEQKSLARVAMVS